MRLARSLGQSLFVSLTAVLILFGAVATQAAPPPDPVLEWIAIMNDSALAAGTNPLLTSRVVALGAHRQGHQARGEARKFSNKTI